MESQIVQIADEIAACKFRFTYSEKEYQWLIAKCGRLVGILRAMNAEPKLIGKLSDIGKNLEEQNTSLTKDILRQKALTANQDAIIFNLMREGFLKLLRS